MSWHKRSSGLSIEQIAQQCYQSAVREYGEGLEQCCLMVSEDLAEALCRNGYPADVCDGFVVVDQDIPNDEFGPSREHLHYWVEVGGTVVDVTAKQFNKWMNSPFPPVIIAPRSSLPNYRGGPWSRHENRRAWKNFVAQTQQPPQGETE